MICFFAACCFIKFILLRFYFSPQLVIDHIVFVAQKLEGFTVCKLRCIWKGDRTVADGGIFNQFSSCCIGDRVCNVVKIHFSNIRAAEKVDKFFCIFFVPVSYTHLGRKEMYKNAFIVGGS